MKGRLYLFILQRCVCVCVCVCVWKEMTAFWIHPLTISPWNSPGQNTGVGNISLLQGIFPTQGSNPGLLHCWQIPYQLSHKGSQRILEWVAYSFSRGSFQRRNWTGVSWIAGGFFTNWAIKEAEELMLLNCGVGEDSWESLGQKGDPTSPS